MTRLKRFSTAIAAAAILGGLTFTAAPANAASWEEGFHGFRPVVCADGSLGEERIRTGEITCESEILDGDGKLVGDRANKVDQTHIKITNENTGEWYIWVTGLTEEQAAKIRAEKFAGADVTVVEGKDEAKKPAKKVTKAEATAIAKKAGAAAKAKVTKIDAAALKSAKAAATKAAKAEAKKVATKAAKAAKTAALKAKSTKTEAKKVAAKAKAKVKKSASKKTKDAAYSKAYGQSVKKTADKAYDRKYSASYKSAYTKSYNKALTAQRAAKLKSAKNAAYTKAYNSAYAKALKK